MNCTRTLTTTAETKKGFPMMMNRRTVSTERYDGFKQAVDAAFFHSPQQPARLTTAMGAR
jgi:hypothetical protein